MVNRSRFGQRSPTGAPRLARVGVYFYSG